MTAVRTNIGIMQLLHTGAGYSSVRSSKNGFTQHTTERLGGESTPGRLCCSLPTRTGHQRVCAASSLSLGTVGEGIKRPRTGARACNLCVCLSPVRLASHCLSKSERGLGPAVQRNRALSGDLQRRLIHHVRASRQAFVDATDRSPYRNRVGEPGRTRPYESAPRPVAGIKSLISSGRSALGSPRFARSPLVFGTLCIGSFGPPSLQCATPILRITRSCHSGLLHNFFADRA